MLNIICWFQTKGILLLTLRDDRVRERLPLDRILHIEHGRIRSVPTNNDSDMNSISQLLLDWSNQQSLFRYYRIIQKIRVKKSCRSKRVTFVLHK